MYKLAFLDSYFNVFYTRFTVILEIVFLILILKCLILQSIAVHQSSFTCGGRWLHGADPSFSVIIRPKVSSLFVSKYVLILVQNHHPDGTFLTILKLKVSLLPTHRLLGTSCSLVFTFSFI